MGVGLGVLALDVLDLGSGLGVLARDEVDLGGGLGDLPLATLALVSPRSAAPKPDMSGEASLSGVGSLSLLSPLLYSIRGGKAKASSADSMAVDMCLFKSKKSGATLI